MSKVVGIDLGTTNSLIATLDEGQPWVIPDEEGELLLPSYVGMSESGQLLVGSNLPCGSMRPLRLSVQ